MVEIFAIIFHPSCVIYKENLRHDIVQIIKMINYVNFMPFYVILSYFFNIS